MGFTTETFLFIFLPISIIIVVAFSLLIKKVKVTNIVLVILSLFFYAWSGWDTLVVFLALILFVYLLGYLAHGFNKKSDSKTSKKLMAFSVAILVAILFFYKYIPFLIQTFNSISEAKLSVPGAAIPLGISFIIFESISYIIDIYRGDAEPGSLLDTFLFLSFFPKLISGPIVQWKDFHTQVYKRQVDFDKISHGAGRIVIGFAKKAIIADVFGAQISRIETQMTSGGVDTVTMWLRVLLFFFQLYYDFSGYSDIAIGLSEIFGFSIKENFNFPYISQSITEFWRRWHVSLGSWFREYVYIPLGGNRKGNRVYLNLFIVFVLTGIWHGANWTFLVWGVINAVFVVIERLIRDKSWYKTIPAIIKWLFTMAVVFFAWIFFMSPNLSSAFDTFGVMFRYVSGSGLNFTWRYYLTPRIVILLVIAAIGSVCEAGGIRERINTKVWSTKIGWTVKMVLLLLLLVVDILFVVNSTYSPFMYFQF